MKIERFETWWVERNQCLFDKKRQGSAAMPWDVVVLKLTTDTGLEGIATALAARSGNITESYLHETIAPVVLGRDMHDREKIWHELWTIDRHLTFFPVYLPGPVDVALWDLAAKEANLPLYQYLGAYRTQLPVYASGNFHATIEEYVEEALKYKERGIKAYKAHPGGPLTFDMKVHEAIRKAFGDEYVLMSDPVAEYQLHEAITVGRQLEELGYHWLEEPFRDFELNKYKQLCSALDLPIAATETTRGCHWGVAQSIAFQAADIVRADVSWKDGVTGSMKIAHMAEGFGMNCELHTTTMNYMDVANLHVGCAIRNTEYFEYFVPEENYQLPMKGNLPITKDGMIEVPTQAGIGVELDWDLIKRQCKHYREQRI
jgi:L-alanine-DL-glutamate epimerase-like enolase superfamily enzyme